MHQFRHRKPCDPQGVLGRHTNDLSCCLDYARGGGGSGGKLWEGGASTLTAITRDGGAIRSVFPSTAAAARAVIHGPIAWHIGRFICLSQGIRSGMLAAAAPGVGWSVAMGVLPIAIVPDMARVIPCWAGPGITQNMPLPVSQSWKASRVVMKTATKHEARERCMSINDALVGRELPPDPSPAGRIPWNARKYGAPSACPL